MSNGNQNTPYILTIGTNDAGQRLDNYLFKHLKGVPKGHVYKIVRKGEVRVNKKRSRVSQRLQLGDQIRIPPLRVSQEKKLLPSSSSISSVLESIIFEDEHIMALNKPARWAVHGGSGNEIGIIETLKRAKQHSPYIELVHRLDKETSGCLLIAKSRSALLSLQSMFKSHDGQINKYYTALVKGKWSQGRLKVDAGLSLHLAAGKAKSVQIDPDGKSAITELTLKKRFNTLSLLNVKISTGRMHQIRVHCAHLGHPLAGDNKYGDFEFNRQLKKRYQLSRLFLHAHEISFKHPVTNRNILIQAPLANDLKATLERIENEQI